MYFYIIYDIIVYIIKKGEQMLEVFFTTFIFLVMIFITIIHIYWLKGGLYPGDNYQDLVDKVLGVGDKLPSTFMFIFVIALFVLMAIFPILVYLNIYIIGYEKAILLFFAIIFCIRSFYMFIPFVSNKTTKVFLDLNKKIYAPLCFSLSIAYFYLFTIS
jgi:hypothetical protein